MGLNLRSIPDEAGTVPQHVNAIIQSLPDPLVEIIYLDFAQGINLTDLNELATCNKGLAVPMALTQLSPADKEIVFDYLLVEMDEEEGTLKLSGGTEAEFLIHRFHSLFKVIEKIRTERFGR